jgi:hypothetical protein
MTRGRVVWVIEQWYKVAWFLDGCAADVSKEWRRWRKEAKP